MKKNYLSEVQKFLLIAASVVVVCILVVLGFYIANEGKIETNKGMTQFNKVTSQNTDVTKELYDGLEVKGATVRDVIQDAIDNADVTIEYKTLANATITTATATTLTIAATDTSYINPEGVFEGDVVKDDNGVITKIVFTQVKR